MRTVWAPIVECPEDSGNHIGGSSLRGTARAKHNCWCNKKINAVRVRQNTSKSHADDSHHFLIQYEMASSGDQIFQPVVCAGGGLESHRCF
jgi:hypothetical protein